MSDDEFSLEDVEEAMQEIEAAENAGRDADRGSKVGQLVGEFLGKLRFWDENSDADTQVHIEQGEDGERLATVTRIYPDEEEEVVAEGRIHTKVIRESSEFVVEHKKEGAAATIGLVALVGTLYSIRKRRK